MKVDDLLNKARESMAARTVFAEPYEHDGVTVIAAARVLGGGGGGSGTERGARQGDGGGFGVLASPAGAFVIRDGDVRWEPAIDVHRIVAIGGAVVVAGILAVTRIAKARVLLSSARPKTGRRADAR